MTNILSEEEINQFVNNPIISGLVVAAILGAVGLLFRWNKNKSSRNSIRDLIKKELQSYSDFIEEIKNEEGQYSSIIEIRTPELNDKAKVMLSGKYNTFSIRHFDNLTPEEKSKYFKEVLDDLENTYQKIRNYSFARDTAWFSILKSKVLVLKGNIDSMIKALDDN